MVQGHTGEQMAYNALVKKGFTQVSTSAILGGARVEADVGVTIHVERGVMSLALMKVMANLT